MTATELLLTEIAIAAIYVAMSVALVVAMAKGEEE